MENKEDSFTDWKWQLKHAIKSLPELEKYINLTDSEKTLIKPDLPLKITPYYAKLLATLGEDHPLRKCVIPSSLETKISPSESIDPLNEEEHSPVKGIVHKYPDRCLFLVTNTCSVYCRYCTRSRIIEKDNYSFNGSDWREAVQYIETHKEIRDVLISGGDPLLMADTRIKDLLTSIRRIKHVEIIRIGTKVPAVLPYRITPHLIDTLRKFHPLYMSIHFTHVSEITPEVIKACNMLADAGIVMRSQTVLLKGINDSTEDIKNLMQKLLTIRVTPYYLYSVDNINGSEHFRVPIQKGIQIINELRGYTSGYAVPTFVVDTEIGKIPVNPDYIKLDNDFGTTFTNYMGKSVFIPK